MTTALAPPFLLAALLLCVAGALKLRSPHLAGEALPVLGLPGTASIVRLLAAGEFALGAWCVVHPTRATAAVLAGVYATFAGVAAALVRRRATGCGCFGETEAPVSAVHWVTSLVFAAVALAAIVAGPHGMGWVFSRPAPTAGVLLTGIAGALYATVLVYTQLPAAWTAWAGE